MLRIRLARVGKKKQAQYRIVVADKRRAVQAKFVEILGWYNPHSKEISVKKDRAEEWMSKGAQPSNSLAVLFKKEKIKLPDWVEVKKKKKKTKKKGKEELEGVKGVEGKEETKELEDKEEKEELSDKGSEIGKKKIYSTGNAKESKEKPGKVEEKNRENQEESEKSEEKKE